MSSKGKVLLGGLALLLFCLIVWAVRTVPEPPPPIEKTDEPKIMSYEGNTITEEKDGVRIWDLTAEKSHVDVESQDAEMENIVGHFYQPNGRVLELKAPHGEYSHDTGDIKLTGGVVATTNDKMDLSADTLTWLAKEEKLIAEGNAKANSEGHGFHIKAEKIESTDGFQKFKAMGKAHIELEGKKK